MKKIFRIFRNKPFLIAFLIVVVLLSAGGYYWYARENQVAPQYVINFLEKIKIPQKNEKVLVFSPHPDDESIGVGGYIAQARKNKADVQIILVTNGNKHHLEKTRYAEFKKATKILGVSETKLSFMNYPDGKMKQQNLQKVKTRFAERINQYQPDYILYPNPYDQHPDHAVIGHLVQKILEKNKKILGYHYLVHHSRFPQPKKFYPDYYLLPPVKMISLDRKWLNFQLSSSLEDQKTLAVYAYKTQLKVPFLRNLILSMIRKNELLSIRQ